MGYSNWNVFIYIGKCDQHPVFTYTDGAVVSKKLGIVKARTEEEAENKGARLAKRRHISGFTYVTPAPGEEGK